MPTAAELINYGFYFNRVSRNILPDSQSLSVMMGDRDRETGRYSMITNSNGQISSHFIGRSNSRPAGYTTQIELGNGQNWGDS